MMESRKIEIDRIDLKSSRPFAEVIKALQAAIGHPDLAALRQIVEGAGSFEELERTIKASLGRSGLMLFAQFDLGAVVRKQSGRDGPKILRLLIGNPLIMAEMARHTPEAGAYAPVTVLVHERADGVHLAYDRMASLLAPYGNPASLAVARSLDLKLESLLREAAGL